MKADNEADRAYDEWYEGLQTIDNLFSLLETAEGPGDKAKWPKWAEDED